MSNRNKILATAAAKVSSIATILGNSDKHETTWYDGEEMDNWIWDTRKKLAERGRLLTRLRKCQQERDAIAAQYDDGMKALLWLVQLHSKAESEDAIEEALEVAEDKLAIWKEMRDGR